MQVAALYQFTAIEQPQALVDALRQCCAKAGTLGTLLVAHEGINGTISGSESAIGAVLDFLREDGRFDRLSIKYSTADGGSFYRMKVKLKKEIVTMGVASVSPQKSAGHYVKAEDWNALIDDPDTLVVDTRNDYETKIGSFKGAVDPQTERFGQMPKWMDEHILNKPEDQRPKRVAMFCTGGIRCEKSTAYLVDHGFDSVFHLDGGILKYLETVPEQQSRWQGECFVFDQRVSVKHGLVEGTYDVCHACRQPISAADKALPSYVVGVSCRHCEGQLSEDKLAALRQRQLQITLAKQRGEAHIGVVPQKP